MRLRHLLGFGLLLGACSHAGATQAGPGVPGQHGRPEAERAAEDTGEVLTLIIIFSRSPAPSGGQGASSQLPPSSQPTVVPVMQRVGECDNWDAAMELARQRACCGVNPERPNRGDRQCPCQKVVPCDICLFLNHDRPPKMYITDMPAYGDVDPTATPGVEDSFSKWETQVGYIQRDLCRGKEKVELLAATLVHESSHLCTSITYAPAPDAFGRQTKETEDCHAYGVEYKCGFKVRPPEGTACFIITK